MIVSAELLYLLYANNDYCIINMWQGGVIVYDFTTQEISNRITFEELEKAGFSYPTPMVSEDGSKIEVPNSNENKKSFGQNCNKYGKGETRALISCIFDVFNYFFILTNSFDKIK